MLNKLLWRKSELTLLKDLGKIRIIKRLFPWKKIYKMEYQLSMFRWELNENYASTIVAKELSKSTIYIYLLKGKILRWGSIMKKLVKIIVISIILVVGIGTLIMLNRITISPQTGKTIKHIIRVIDGLPEDDSDTMDLDDSQNNNNIEGE